MRNAPQLVTFVMLAGAAHAAPEQARQPAVAPQEVASLGFPVGCAAGSDRAACRCSALVPKDAGWRWAEAPAQPYWTAAVRRGNQLAVWGIVGVNPAMQGRYATHQGDLYGHPEASMLFLANVLAAGLGDRSDARYTSEPVALGAYHHRFFETLAVRGVVLYRLWSDAAGPFLDGHGYIENMYFAVAPRSEWDASWREIASVALSVNCTASMMATSGGVSARESTLATRDANHILGTEYVHDASCANFLVGDANWIDDGPAGAGYYKEAGTAYQKLAAGRCD